MKNHHWRIQFAEYRIGSAKPTGRWQWLRDLDDHLKISKFDTREIARATKKHFEAQYPHFAFRIAKIIDYSQPRTTSGRTLAYGIDNIW